ncbi:hypothetical protein OROHE_000262 [Orobanche hederae]
MRFPLTTLLRKMFTLRIHTPDTFHPEFTGTKITVAGELNPNSSEELFSEEYIRDDLKGVVHLYRNRPRFAYSPDLPLFDARRTTFVFIVYVPMYLSTNKFIDFCGHHTKDFSYLYFISHDSVEDRYSVLIKLVNQSAADEFCRAYKGKRFLSSEERLDHSTSAIKSTGCNHSFGCSCCCVTKLSCPVCLLCEEEDGKPSCEACGTTSNLWACLICGYVGCERCEGGHAFKHFEDKKHSYALEIKTLKISDYFGDKYVHRFNQTKSESGSPSIDKNHQSSSLEGEYCHKEDKEVGGTFYSSKLEGVIGQYNILFETKMARNRQKFEKLLADAKRQKETSIADAVNRAGPRLNGQLEKAKKNRTPVTKEQAEWKQKDEKDQARPDIMCLWPENLKLAGEDGRKSCRKRKNPQNPVIMKAELQNFRKTIATLEISSLRLISNNKPTGTSTGSNSGNRRGK